MSGYLVELRLAGKRAVVVGLGAVGRRKASGLLEAGAIVWGIDPADIALEPNFASPAFTRIREPYQADHLQEAALAIASATSDVNAQVVADARARGVWVNSASDPENGDLIVPAVWRDGPLVAAVSTGGVSPALAATLRDRVAIALGDAARLLEILKDLRPIALERLAEPNRRRLMRDWADPRWLDLLHDQGAQRVAEMLRAELDEAIKDESAASRTRPRSESKFNSDE